MPGGTDVSARRNPSQCPAGPICLIPPPGCLISPPFVFGDPSVCVLFSSQVSIFFWLLVACFSRPMLFSGASGVFGRWLELFSSPGVLFLSNWWLEYMQNMLPDSKYFPGDPVFFYTPPARPGPVCTAADCLTSCCDSRLLGGSTFSSCCPFCVTGNQD